MLNEEKAVHTDEILINVASERDTVQAAIDAAIDTANGHLPEAAKLLEARAKADPDLFHLIAGPYLPAACWALMRRRAWADRTMLWTAPNADPHGNGQRVHHLAQENLRNWLEDFRLPIPGLPKLGDATKEEVQAGAEHYFKQAKTELQRGKFLERVSGLLKGKKPVRAQLNNEDIARVADEALVHIE